jgi:hypothetical protein
MKLHTAAYCAAITLGVGSLQMVSANDFQTTVKASSEHVLGSKACEMAFDQAEREALDQLDERFDADGSGAYIAKLIAQKETRTVRDDNKTVCVFEGTWEAKPLNDVADLIGTELWVEGKYTGSCLDEGNGDICWQRIIRQAEQDIFEQLSNDHANLDSIALHYTDFEGRQRDQYRNKRLEMTADGRFFFDVVPYDEKPQSTRISIHRKDTLKEVPEEPAKPVIQPSAEKPPEQKKKEDNIDITLFYTWDGNDTARQNDLAISSSRWGIGVWANNRLGFAAFAGEDQLGLGDDRENVKNSSGTYETLGVGMGFRLWPNRGVTLENMLYYVDAQPYSTTVSPDCDSCTDRAYTSKDYLQTTVNLKTNSKGVNFGWMFTWKFLENEINVDSLSSGFYLEAQF